MLRYSILSTPLALPILILMFLSGVHSQPTEPVPITYPHQRHPSRLDRRNAIITIVCLGVTLLLLIAGLLTMCISWCLASPKREARRAAKKEMRRREREWRRMEKQPDLESAQRWDETGGMQQQADGEFVNRYGAPAVPERVQRW